MTGQLSPLAQGKAAGYTSKLLKTGQTTQYNSELDDGYYEKGVAKSYTVNTTGAQSGTTITNSQVVAWFSGGTAGTTYRVECLITTSAGRTDERSLWITVQER